MEINVSDFIPSFKQLNGYTVDVMRNSREKLLLADHDEEFGFYVCSIAKYPSVSVKHGFPTHCEYVFEDYESAKNSALDLSLWHHHISGVTVSVFGSQHVVYMCLPVDVDCCEDGTE